MSDETYTTDLQKVECPYCGHTNDLSESVGSRGESLDSWECYECLQGFDVRVCVTIGVRAMRILA